MFKYFSFSCLVLILYDQLKQTNLSASVFTVDLVRNCRIVIEPEKIRWIV